LSEVEKYVNVEACNFILVTDKRIWKTPAGLKKWIEKRVVLKLLMFDYANQMMVVSS
jgi:hypothetical protein